MYIKYLRCNSIESNSIKRTNNWGKRLITQRNCILLHRSLCDWKKQNPVLLEFNWFHIQRAWTFHVQKKVTLWPDMTMFFFFNRAGGQWVLKASERGMKRKSIRGLTHTFLKRSRCNCNTKRMPDLWVWHSDLMCCDNQMLSVTFWQIWCQVEMLVGVEGVDIQMNARVLVA